MCLIMITFYKWLRNRATKATYIILHIENQKTIQPSKIAWLTLVIHCDKKSSHLGS